MTRQPPTTSLTRPQAAPFEIVPVREPSRRIREASFVGAEFSRSVGSEKRV